eukprot:scaffold285903_cov13-Tisochrysis_lutea.AAC.1
MSCSWASVTAAPPKPKQTEEPPAPPAARLNGTPNTAGGRAPPAPATAPAAPATPAKEPQYEPAPNEIKHVTLSKPTADAVLGIRLAGRD